MARLWRDYNYFLLGCVIVLTGFRLALVYSTTLNDPATHGYFSRGQATVELVIKALQDEYLCCAAYDGESALLAITTARPALVLLDLHFPDLSGVDVAAQLRRQDLAQVPIVLMTADATAATELPTTPFPEHLLKPFNFDDLLACVARFVRRCGGRTSSLAAGSLVCTGTQGRLA